MQNRASIILNVDRRLTLTAWSSANVLKTVSKGKAGLFVDMEPCCRSFLGLNSGTGYQAVAVGQCKHMCPLCICSASEDFLS